MLVRVFGKQRVSLLHSSKKDGDDERYKFRMTVKEGTEFEWFGSVNEIILVPTTQRQNHSGTWYRFRVINGITASKFAGEIDNSLSDISVVFQADNSYTHIIKK